jgi:hypothetical protein
MERRPPTRRDCTLRRTQSQSKRFTPRVYGSSHQQPTAKPAALVLKTGCAVSVCNAPLLQAPNEVGRYAGITKLLR